MKGPGPFTGKIDKIEPGIRLIEGRGYQARHQAKGRTHQAYFETLKEAQKWLKQTQKEKPQ